MKKTIAAAAAVILLAVALWMHRYSYEHTVVVNPTQSMLIRVDNFTGETCMLDIGDGSFPLRWVGCGK